MKKFLIRICVFLLIFFIFDNIIYFFLQTQRPLDYKIFIDSKTSFFYNQYKTDLLIIGDSHIADALDTRVIEEETDLSVYNLGVYSSSPFENYFTTKSALEHMDSPPKIVVLGTNPIMFQRDLNKGSFTPIILKSNFELFFNSNNGVDFSFFIKTYREKKLLKHIVKKLLGYKYIPTRIIEDSYNGHLKFYNQMNNINWDNADLNKYSNSINKNQIKYFKKTIELLLEYDIDVIIVNPPIYSKEFTPLSKNINYIKFKKTIDSVKNIYQLNVFNPEGNLLFKELLQNDFLNKQHLNYNGSIKFSNDFSDFLKNLNQKNYNQKTNN